MGSIFSEKVGLIYLLIISNRQDQKPLVWQIIRNSPRFAFVKKEKIEAVIVSEWSDSEADIWRYEDSQTRAGVEAVRAWSEAGGDLYADDLLISADVDEVLSREALHHLRHCSLTRPVISGALIVPFGNLNKAFR